MVMMSCNEVSYVPETAGCGSKSRFCVSALACTLHIVFRQSAALSYAVLDSFSSKNSNINPILNKQYHVEPNLRMVVDIGGKQKLTKITPGNKTSE